jgi:hypothetical protein
METSQQPVKRLACPASDLESECKKKLVVSVALVPYIW